MDYLVDTLTKTPKQALLTSSKTFGEEAAKVFGSIIEESLKNATNDITTSLDTNVEKADKLIKKVAIDFGDKFEESLISSFTEWGYAIERAFVALGAKIETGIVNTAYKICSSVEDISENKIKDLTDCIDDVGTKISNSIDQFGINQVKSFKIEFYKEINIIIYSILLISISIFIFTLSYATK